MHIHISIIMYCSRLFVVVFFAYILLNMTLFIGSKGFISPPNFMFVSPSVSELREWIQNKKKKMNSVSNLPWAYN